MKINTMLKKLKYYLLTVLVTVYGCTKENLDANDSIADKWNSINGLKHEVWFQNWGEYSRLFLIIHQDTIVVEPNPYSTASKDKQYLKPKKFEKVVKQQLIGNLYWNEKPRWDSGTNNQAVWIVDRANPKLKLPMELKIDALVMLDTLKLRVRDNSSLLYDLKMKKLGEY